VKSKVDTMTLLTRFHVRHCPLVQRSD